MASAVLTFDTFVLTELEQRGFDNIRIMRVPDHHQGMCIVLISATFNGHKVTYSYPRPYDIPVTDAEAEFLAFYMQTSTLY
jgi:hypothetical protein